MTNKIQAAISCLTMAQRLVGADGKMLLVASDQRGRKSIVEQTNKMVRAMLIAAVNHCTQAINDMGEEANDEGDSW